MEPKNKAKTEGTKQQQNHRTQEWTNSYKGKGTEEDGWERIWTGKKKGDLMISMYNVGWCTRRAEQHREDK